MRLVGRRGRPKFKFDRRIGKTWEAFAGRIVIAFSLLRQHGDKPRAVMSEYCVRFIAKQIWRSRNSKRS
ncbi:MAG: hypothetical protein ACKERG_01075 [Candidatus Hodgkinia cicadicola]